MSGSDEATSIALDKFVGTIRELGVPGVNLSCLRRDSRILGGFVTLGAVLCFLGVVTVASSSPNILSFIFLVSVYTGH